MEVMEQRAPYVDFEIRPVEDRNASIETGHYIARDVHYALITPQGSKDRVERVVSEWFAHLATEVKDGRFPSEWLRIYRNAYEEWKAGNEIPLHGTPIKTCPIFSPAQIKILIELNVRTLEDLTLANEETLMRIGMGSHDLKAKAQAFLQAAVDKGQLASQVAAFQAENQDLKDDNERLRDDVKSLDERLQALEKADKPKAQKL